ncbi:MAG: dihydrodipicolinate synthase family protein [Candidatus Marinimicrobia bacterium]|nr:dihydrodipicolinate synthase family protein [Candidatus Neomarinimicrobiota bacterium]
MQTYKHQIGLVAAAPTGFLADGRVDLAVIPHLAEHLQKQGVAGVFINGTTGESMSLTVAERVAQAEAWRRACPPSIRLYVHVGHNSVAEARQLAAQAQALGADAVASIAPGFFKPARAADLAEWCAEVAGGAPELPFYFYHMPSMNGVGFAMTPFLEIAGPRIPNLAGIKFTFESLADYQAAQAVADGRYDILWGRDEMLLGALATGARGAVGSTYNVAAPLFLDLMAAFARGDLATARERQLQAIGMINAMIATGNFFVALKAMLRAQGVPISTRVRLPLANLDDQALQAPEVPCLQ